MTFLPSAGRLARFECRPENGEGEVRMRSEDQDWEWRAQGALVLQCTLRTGPMAQL